MATTPLSQVVVKASDFVTTSTSRAHGLLLDLIEAVINDLDLTPGSGGTVPDNVVTSNVDGAVFVFSDTDPGALGPNQAWVQPTDRAQNVVSVATTAATPAGGTVKAAPTNPAELDTVLRATIPVGAPGIIVTRMQAFVTTTNDSPYIWVAQVLVDGAEIRADYLLAREKADSDWSVLELRVAGLTPGQTVEVRWKHFTTSTAAGAASVEVESGLGKQVTLTVTAL